MSSHVDVYFSDAFNVSLDELEAYGAFNVCLVTDLPLFIDPFLLFNSDVPEYIALHDQIIRYLRFLRDRSLKGPVSKGLLEAWYHFGEVDENCFGLCKAGHSGRGLGSKFAKALHKNLHDIFSEFGEEKVTESSHLEKLCLIENGVGKDMISDFTTNLIKSYLCHYTQKFAQEHLSKNHCRIFAVKKAEFNYDTQTWMTRMYELPAYEGKFILLTPKGILTRDDTWINRSDMIRDFEQIPEAISNDALRAQVDNYFRRMLPEDPEKKDYDHAAVGTYLKFPWLIDYYIKHKEENGDQATQISDEKVNESASVYISQFGSLISLLASETKFYEQYGNTEKETRARIEYFKSAIEKKGCHKIFYHKGVPIRNETDAHILYQMTWFASPSDVTREANDGRGPVDFKISRGAKDKTLVEFKLASNSKIRSNLEKQLEVYQAASDAPYGFKVIIYFNERDKLKVERLLRELKLDKDDHVYLVDARMDNKPSGSNA